MGGRPSGMPALWTIFSLSLSLSLCILLAFNSLFVCYCSWLTSSRSAQPTLIGSSAPLRPRQLRYRELGPGSEDGLSLSAVPTCGTVFLRLSAPSTPTRPSAVLSKLICSSLRLTINCFYFYYYYYYFIFYHLFDYVMHGRPDSI